MITQTILTNLAGVFSDPILIDEQRGRISSLRFGSGTLFLVVLGGICDGTSGFTRIILRGWNQIEHKSSFQSGAELAYYKAHLQIEEKGGQIMKLKSEFLN